MKRFVCIHCHFYQPPRENPWIEAIEVQSSAYPYHDWNERIAAECYTPNTASRLLDPEARILKVINNYAKISFNVGPSLMAWLEKKSPKTYRAILEADRLSLADNNGHGAAIAQCYNHLIMPLANRRDKETQIHWGIRDFSSRFERQPEGMWLPETAVDLETLEILAAHDIRFTILAPHQAKAHRPLAGGAQWLTVAEQAIDVNQPYLCPLPSGRTMTIFFYNGVISQDIAFNSLLQNGELLRARLLAGFTPEAQEAELVHISTDGESYGHHHRFGDMALAFALDSIEAGGTARLCNYGAFLAEFPARHEVRIVENSSWSCVHGIERWRDDCGCSSGGYPHWNQQWRQELRRSLDWLRDKLASLYEVESLGLLDDPWGARQEYIAVVRQRSASTITSFVEQYGGSAPDHEARIRILKLLETQRHAMLMYTSCGWFFDEISGLETTQILRYACRAMQLAGELTGIDLETEFKQRLAAAPSNIAEYGDGGTVYERFVRPTMVTIARVAAHFAISSLFQPVPRSLPMAREIYCYTIDLVDYRRTGEGSRAIITGSCRVSSQITNESSELVFSMFYVGGHDFNCGIAVAPAAGFYHTMSGQLHTLFEQGGYSDVVRAQDRFFPGKNYTLLDLFHDEKRAILTRVIEEPIAGFKSVFKTIYEENRLLMLFLKRVDMPINKAFLAAAEMSLNVELQEALEQLDTVERLREILAEAEQWGVTVYQDKHEFYFRKILEERMEMLAATPFDLALLEETVRLVDIARQLPFSFNLWSVQNRYYELAGEMAARHRQAGRSYRKGDSLSLLFRELGDKLSFNMATLDSQEGASDEQG